MNIGDARVGGTTRQQLANTACKDSGRHGPSSRPKLASRPAQPTAGPPSPRDTPRPPASPIPRGHACHVTSASKHPRHSLFTGNLLVEPDAALPTA
jgi:hypothetical protein